MEGYGGLWRVDFQTLHFQVLMFFILKSIYLFFYFNIYKSTYGGYGGLEYFFIYFFKNFFYFFLNIAKFSCKPSIPSIVPINLFSYIFFNT
jgi:hypothetical protein